jgi:hypothetical protein
MALFLLSKCTHMVLKTQLPVSQTNSKSLAFIYLVCPMATSTALLLSTELNPWDLSHSVKKMFDGCLPRASPLHWLLQLGDVDIIWSFWPWKIYNMSNMVGMYPCLMQWCGESDDGSMSETQPKLGNAEGIIEIFEEEVAELIFEQWIRMTWVDVVYILRALEFVAGRDPGQRNAYLESQRWGEIVCTKNEFSWSREGQRGWQQKKWTKC